MDMEHDTHPGKGVRQMRLALISLGISIGIKRMRRLMRTMGIEAYYAKPNLSRLGRARYIHPYLLRGKDITRPNQVWSTDITYIRMPCGHAYLYAVIDAYSRFIVGWGLYTTLDAVNAIEVLQRAIDKHGKPCMINSDQGSQYTSQLWVDFLQSSGIQISMDGRCRCLDNHWIERFWHTLKGEYVYLHPHSSVPDMRHGIDGWIRYYNTQRRHSSINGRTPEEYYQQARASAA